jgi:hypothetical protein
MAPSKELTLREIKKKKKEEEEEEVVGEFRRKKEKKKKFWANCGVEAQGEAGRSRRKNDGAGADAELWAVLLHFGGSSRELDSHGSSEAQDHRQVSGVPGRPRAGSALPSQPRVPQRS